ETKRAYSYLSLYNKNVECLVINKVIPDDADGEFLRMKLEEQKGYMQAIHESFDPLKIFTAYMLKTEMRGQEKLELLGDMIFGDADPIEVYSTESPMHFVTKEDGIDQLVIKMPFVDQDQIELYKGQDNTIILQVGSQRRTVSLPMTLANAELLGAEFGDECLCVNFKRP
ncbi:MAG: ArsA family ATPase, partial [Candidatus Methanomethylophilus sp.]|nr:ArsA family ATPase [Methanomethylophilus sp.]